MGGRTPGPISNPEDLGRTTVPGPLGLEPESSAAAITIASFKQAVFNQQLANARASGKTYFPPVPNTELEPVEGGFVMRKSAAQDCLALLAAARADLAKGKSAGDSKARQVIDLGICSTYRDYKHDMRAWDSTFETHYLATRNERGALPGGAHGPAAVQLLVRRLQKYKAVPGFSNHSNGTAVDFQTTEGGTTYAALSSQREGWRITWFHAWLIANAGSYGFKPLATEEWHWDHAPAS